MATTMVDTVVAKVMGNQVRTLERYYVYTPKVSFNFLLVPELCVEPVSAARSG